MGLQRARPPHTQTHAPERAHEQHRQRQHVEELQQQQRACVERILIPHPHPHPHPLPPSPSIPPPLSPPKFNSTSQEAYRSRRTRPSTM